ncbi:putative symporter YagG [compost metagenome]
MFYACSSVGIKVGTGLGTALAGILLSLSSYDGLAATQTESTLRSITLIFLLAPLIGCILLTILFYFLNIDEVNKKLKNSV